MLMMPMSVRSDLNEPPVLVPDDQSAQNSSGSGQPFAAVRTSIKGPAPPIPSSAPSSASSNKSEKVRWRREFHSPTAMTFSRQTLGHLVV